MRVGVLGYGFMGAAHVAAMQRIDGLEVAAVASRVRPSADAPARGNLDLRSGPLPDTVAWVPDWRDIIVDPQIDAVDVCLPTDMHCQVVLAALAVGKHVLCEKPMALSARDCDMMLAATRASSPVLMVGQVLRFMFPYMVAETFVRAQGRETIEKAVLRRSTGFPGWGGWLADEGRSGGAILDLLSHDLDQALHLFGHPETVRAESLGPVDTMLAALQYGDGVEVIVEGGWLEPETPFSAGFEIHGSESVLRFENGVIKRLTGNEEVTIAIPEHDAYHDQIAYFVACCEQGTQPERCPPAASADAVRMALLLKQSRDANGKELQWRPQ